MAACSAPVSMHHTHIRITTIIKDIRIQEDSFFCYVYGNIQRQMKESITGKEAQYKLFVSNIKGDRNSFLKDVPHGDSQ